MRYISYNVSKNSKMRFEVEFYETESGKVPIEEFLEKLDDKLRAKNVGIMEILEEKEGKSSSQMGL